MSGLFVNAISQYIDNNGKTRMLTYKYKGKRLSLMTSPIPPLDLPNERKISVVSKETALGFIKDKNFRIASQNRSEEDKTEGFWVETEEEDSDIYYGYIPILKSQALQDVEFSDDTKIVPLQDVQSTDSELQIFRRNKKISEFLKKYTLYTYALNPEEFDKTWFVIDPKHEYDIESLNKKLFVDGNDVMYDSNGYLIVPSKETRDRLMGYLQIQLSNDKPGVLALRDKGKIEDYYQSVSDFRTAPNQLIFTSENGIFRWKRELARTESNRTVSQNLLPGAVEPYFYRSPKIKNGALHVIQNVKKGSLKNATAVSYKWMKDRVNTGYSDPDRIALPEEISYISYTNNGPVPGGTKGKIKKAPVIFYDDGTYGAILFLSEN